MWILLIVVSAIFIQAMGHHFYLSNDTASSGNATRQCNLATPTLMFSKTGQKVNLTHVIPELINESFWVGFVMVYSTFLYKGCSHINQLTNQDITEDIRADPGHCYSFCKTSFIGIQHKPEESAWRACYCLESLPNKLLDDKCTNACELPDGTLCGNNGKHVSVYEKVDTPHTKSSPWTETGDIDGRCLAVVPSEPSHFFIWIGCSRRYRRICQDGNGDITYTDTDTLTDADWKTVMMDCIKNTYFPVDPTTTLPSVQDSNVALWMGVVRSYSIVPQSEVIDSNDSYMQGYIDTYWNLRFSSSLELRSLCMNNISNDSSSSTRNTEIPTQRSTSTSSHPDTTRNSTSPTHSFNNPSSTEMSTQPSISPSSSSTLNSTQNSTSTASVGRKTVQSEESTGGIVALYVVVPLVVIAIAVAIVFVIWRRRRKLPEKESRPPETNSFSHHNGTVSAKGTVGSLEDIKSKQADTTLRHDYLILEPVNEYAAIQDTHLDQDGEEDYDTTEGARGNNTGNDTGNIYNHIEPVSDDTYNHINTFNIRDNDTYNHTGNCGDETTYNTTETLSRLNNGNGAVNSESRQANDVDDTYNHIDEAVSRLDHKHETDDTYNTSECDMRDARQVANAYSYANPSAKTPVGSPDKGNIKYDYAFAEPGVTGGSMKPIMFKLDQSPTDGSYAFATEPSASADYQQAKPPGD